MIVKLRKKPIYLEKMEALLRRLPENHPKRQKVEEALGKGLAGFRGEQSLDYYLSFLDEKEYFILHDVRLLTKEKHFQHDILLLTQSVFIILEIKNISGALTFDSPFNQFIRTIDGKEERFPNPILQVNYQRICLLEWLKKRRFPAVPIEPLVVISNPYTIIKPSPQQAQTSQHVVLSEDIPERIKKIKSNYPDEKMTFQEVRKLYRQLQKQDTPYNPDILKRFQIPRTDLMTGVQCRECFYIPMKRKKAKWSCPVCSFSSKEAHETTLIDYSLLIDSTITNQEVRRFIHISSRSVASKLLKSMNLPRSGTTKGRKYYLHFEE